MEKSERKGKWMFDSEFIASLDVTIIQIWTIQQIRVPISRALPSG